MTPEKLERIAGFPTYVERSGRGQRQALFLHCTLGHVGTWAKVQSVLAPHLSMVAFDRPGHGKSAKWNGVGGAKGLHDLTTQIAAGLMGSKVDLIGHSFGGTVALRLAMEFPSRVRSLTLIEPPLFSLAHGTAEFEAYIAEMEGFSEALIAGQPEIAAQMFHNSVTPEAPWSQLPTRAQARLAGQIARVAEERAVTMEDAAGLTAPGRMEGIACPVLLLEGTASPPIFRAVEQQLAARMPQAKRVLLAGAGHMSPVTHPDNVAGEIAAFLKL
ncbi:MAG: alpha/beta hydrolase [Maritimibacter sp.]